MGYNYSKIQPVLLQMNMFFLNCRPYLLLVCLKLQKDLNLRLVLQMLP